MNTKKGFTIIELIVVIAIIAVLAAIVLVNVTTYIKKSKDAAIKANMNSLVTAYAKFVENNPNNITPALDFPSDPTYTNINTAVKNAGGGTLNYVTGGGTWCYCTPEVTVTTTVYCVDSSGTKKEVSGIDCMTECVGPQMKCQ